MKLYNLLSPLDYSVMFLIHFNRLTLPLVPSKLVLQHAVLISFKIPYFQRPEMKKALGEYFLCSLLHETCMEPIQSLPWVFLLSVKLV